MSKFSDWKDKRNAPAQYVPKIELIQGYPGFGIEYNPAENPFFRAIVTDNLRLIRSKALGVELLEGIAAAKPGSTSDFPTGINVVFRPHMMRYVETGYQVTKIDIENVGIVYDGMKPSTNKAHQVKPTNLEGPNQGAEQCLFHKYGSSLNKAVNTSQTSAGGTVCWVNFSNAQVMMSDGSMCWPHIVLAHELIHSLHCLNGQHAGAEEELKTSGIGQFSGEHMSENSFRDAFGQERRGEYG